jgi:streptomycin 6-kinase
VRARLDEAVESWSLPTPEPLTGGVGALTCAAGEVVVKVLPRHHPEAALMRGEGEALAHWRGSAPAVDLIDRRDDGMTLLLRRVRPATLLDGLPYDEQLAVAGSLVAELHATGQPPSALPSIESFLEGYPSDPERDELIATADRQAAVHADLHGGNVLRDGERWIAIDPKGVRGDPHLDIWLLVCPQAPALAAEDPAADLWRRIAVYADAAGLDPERARRWVGVVARAEAVVSADSAFPAWPERLRRIAAATA